MRQTELKLSEENRATIEAIRSKRGIRRARSIVRMCLPVWIEIFQSLKSWLCSALAARLCGVLVLHELYARTKSKVESVICIDEKSLQLIAHSRAPWIMAADCPSKHDYEYVRNGITNLFVAVEPKAGQRIVSVTERRERWTSSPSSESWKPDKKLLSFPRHVAPVPVPC